MTEQSIRLSAMHRVAGAESHSVHTAAPAALLPCCPAALLSTVCSGLPPTPLAGGKWAASCNSSTRVNTWCPGMCDPGWIGSPRGEDSSHTHQHTPGTHCCLLILQCALPAFEPVRRFISVCSHLAPSVCLVLCSTVCCNLEQDRGQVSAGIR
jgi:hypothetical protein